MIAQRTPEETTVDVRGFLALLFWIGLGICATPYFPAGVVIAAAAGVLWLVAPIPQKIAEKAVAAAEGTPEETEEEAPAKEEESSGGNGCAWIVLLAIVFFLLIVGAVGAGIVGIDATCGAADPVYVTCQ